MADPGRWLNREQCAVYIGVRVDQLPRLVRGAKLPRPSLHLGPNSPRYDREALDRLFLGNAASADIGRAVEQAAQDIIAEANRRHAQRPGGRRRKAAGSAP